MYEGYIVWSHRKKVTEKKITNWVVNGLCLVQKQIYQLIQPPSPVLNVTAKASYKKLRALLEPKDNPKILVIGCGEELGYGMEKLGRRLLNNVVNADIEAYEQVDLAADAHNLPFADSIFDCVIIQAVFGYLHTPQRAVSEINRVLKYGGYVYTDVSFLQGYRHELSDYQRYTLAGLEKLFAAFRIVQSGISCGPSSALAVMLRRYLSFAFSIGNDCLLKGFYVFFGWLVFPIKYLDIVLYKSKQAHMLSSGVALIAQKQYLRTADL